MRFDDIYLTVARPDYGVDLVEMQRLGTHNGAKIFGVYTAGKNVALIDECIGPDSGDPRRIFTLYHEVFGHGVLQGRYIRTQMIDALSAGIVVTAASLEAGMERRGEWQANRFGAAVGAPMALVEAAIQLRLGIRQPVVFAGPGTYWIRRDGRDCRFEIIDFDQFCKIIAGAIHDLFGGLSVTAISYRVAKSRFVRNLGIDMRLMRTG